MNTASYRAVLHDWWQHVTRAHRPGSRHARRRLAALLRRTKRAARVSREASFVARLSYSNASRFTHHSLRPAPRPLLQTFHLSPFTSHPSRLVFESLEPRLLLSAAPVPAGAELSALSFQHSAPESTSLVTGHESLVTEPSALSPEPSAISHQLSAPASRRELVFVDSSIQDPDQLAEGIRRDADVVWLDDERDGIEQISAILADRHNLDAVHIISDGSEGRVKLGSAWISQDTLTRYSAHIAGWKDALAPGADLLFYACDLARGEAGQTLLTALHELTGADVAASTDDTGHAHYGADWDLEYQLGAIETGPVLTQSGQLAWTGLLATMIVGNTNDSGILSLRAAMTAANGDSIADTVTFNILDTLINDSNLANSSWTSTKIGDTTAGQSATFTAAQVATGGNPGSFRRVTHTYNTGTITVAHQSTLASYTPSVSGALDVVSFSYSLIHLNPPAGQAVAYLPLIIQNNSYYYGPTDSIVNQTWTSFSHPNLTASSFSRFSGSGPLNPDFSATGSTIQFGYITQNTSSGGALFRESGLDNFLVSIRKSVNTINLLSALPTISTPMVIDGVTQPGYVGGMPVIELNGAGAGAGTIGLLVVSGGSGSTIRGLVINRFASAGIWLDSGSSGNTISGNFIGTDPTGTIDRGNASDGIVIAGSANNTIGTEGLRNIISGNGGDGIEISNAGATGNKVQGNYIGTNAAGTAALPNDVDGIRLAVSANSNIIGTTPGGVGIGNVISGNKFVGVEIFSSVGNSIGGNYIGTNAAGNAAVPNESVGVYVLNSTNTSPTVTTIGGTAPAARNVISGNMFHGIQLDGSTTGTLIQGNYIGLNKDGNASIGIQDVGVVINNQNPGPTTNNTIGGMTAGARNIISGNEQDGVRIIRIGGSAVTNNVVEGNYIGTDAGGTVDLGNGQFGVSLSGGVTTNRIGGTSTASRNVISGNQDAGVYLADSGTTGNVVQNNYIGTKAGGTQALANGGDGVRLSSGASSNTIGSASLFFAATYGNVIAGNSGNGVNIVGSGTTGNLVQANLIGLGSDGSTVLGNAGHGVRIEASNNTVAGILATSSSTPAGGIPSFGENTIAFNSGDGIAVVSGTGNTLRLNEIFSNGGLGIDLGDDGVTPNDAGDADGGPNNKENYPVLTAAFASGFKSDGTPGGTLGLVRGSVVGGISETIRLDAYANPSSDPSEGKRYAGSFDLNPAIYGTDGFFYIFLDDAVPAVANGEYITVTATRVSTGDTSEFSVPVIIGGPEVDLNGSSNGVDAATTWTENVGPVAIAGSATITDQDSANLQSLTVTITNRQNGAAEVLDATTSGGLTKNYNSGTGVLTLSGSASVSTYQSVLRSVTYNNTSDTPNTTARTVTVVGNDGSNNGNTATSTITIVATNDAPVNTVPGVQSTNEDQARVFSSGNSNLISISDPDAGSNAVQVTLTGTNGTITLNGTSGLSFTVGDGTADGTMTFTGTITNINTALNGLSFGPTANFNGTASLQILTNDQGNTGSGGALSDTDSVSITVNAVNDAPSFTKGADQTVNEDAGAQSVTNWSTNISAGPNESGQTLTFNITNNTNAALFSAGPAISSTGTLTYTPAANANGTATITVALQDNGGTANGGQNTSAGQSFVITVNAVNDAPSFTKGVDQTVNEDAGAQPVANWATNLSRGPADESGQTLTFNIANNTNAALFSVGPAISSTGTLTYTPAANANGSATITVALQDNGGTANGGQNTSAGQSFVITVNPINDPPVLTNNGGGATAAISIPENSTAVTTLTSTDIDGGPPVYTIVGGADQARFSLNQSTGVLTFLTAPDFDAPTDANADNVYDVTVQVSDGAGGVDQQVISVTVTNVADSAAITTTSDVADGDTSSIEALNTNPGPDGAISLREAILAANNSPNGATPDRINFAYAGTGVHTIHVSSAPPTITDAVIIDGTTQPGYAGLPLIEVDGASAGLGVNGLVINAGGSGTTIRGLAINRFSGAGIRLDGGGFNLLEGNVIGTNAAGTAALGNGDGVLIVNSANNLIGGLTGAARNLISGNSGDGLELTGASAIGNQILGNFIGTNITGTVGLGNGANGVLINGAGGTIVGDPTVPAGANRMAFNTGAGVAITAGTGTRLEGNAIFSNGGLGIDLGPTGVTPNDGADADTGANQLQNAPVLTSAWPDGTVVNGTLNSTPSRTFTLEFYANTTGDASGFGEGQRFLGRGSVATDGTGQAVFQLTLNAPVTLSEIVTATATDAQGNTSEFSGGVAVTATGVATFPLTVKTNGTGQGNVKAISPAGIDLAAGDFTERYPKNTLVTLEATPDPGFEFAGWSGYGLTSSNPRLTIPVYDARIYTATFVPANSGEQVPPTVRAVQLFSHWANSLTVTWNPLVPPAGWRVISYNIYLSRPSDPGAPILVALTDRGDSYTFTDLEIEPHQATVTAVLALVGDPTQTTETGHSNFQTRTPNRGLEGWNVINEGTDPNPPPKAARADWSNLDVDTRYGQYGELFDYGQFLATGTPSDLGLRQRGTFMYAIGGIAQNRRDYELMLNLGSLADGALGVMLRYVDPNNYYRFSMERDPNNDGNLDDAYIRLLKVQNGQASVLRQDNGELAEVRGPDAAYATGNGYVATLLAVAPRLEVRVQDPNGSTLADWVVTDTTFTSNGLALYSSRNAGSLYRMSILQRSNPDPNLLDVDLYLVGTGAGEISSTVNGEIGSLSTTSTNASIPRGATLTVTATPNPDSMFDGWYSRDLVNQTDNLVSIDMTYTLPAPLAAGQILVAVFTLKDVPPPSHTLDLNGDGVVTAETDGRVALKYLGGALPEGPLATSLVSPQATTAMLRPTGADVKSWLDTSGLTMLDVDLDGRLNPFTDGRLVFRFLQQREQNVIDDAALLNGSVRGAGALRTTAADIRAFLNGYLPPPAPAPATTELSSVGTQLSAPIAEPSAISSQLSAPGNPALSVQPSPFSVSEPVLSPARPGSPQAESSVPIGEPSAISSSEISALSTQHSALGQVVPMGYAASLSLNLSLASSPADDQPLLTASPAWLGDFVVSSAVLTDDPNRDLAVAL